MSTTRDPIRVTDPRSGADPELAAAFRALRERHGSVEEARALEQRVAAQLKRISAAKPKLDKLKPFTWPTTVLVLGTAGAFTFATPSLSRELSQRPASSVATPERVDPRPNALVERPMPALPAPPTPVERLRPRRHRRAPPVSVPESPGAATPAPEAELELLLRARAELRRNPALALELAEQHARDYPNGVFGQEREVLAIDAGLQRHTPDSRAAARARAQQFVASHPESAHAVRMRHLLEDWAGPPAARAAGAVGP